MIQRKDGRWQKSLRINGKKIYFYSSESTKEKAEADINRKMLAYQEEQHNDRHNFKALAEQTIEVRNIGYKTEETYRLALRHLSPLYAYDIEKIKPSNVQAVLDGMARQGYSFSAISKVKTFFGLILDFAVVEKDLALNNFSSSLKVPKNVSKNKITSPDEEVIDKIKKLAQNENSDGNFESWAISLYCTGMRRGELAALQRKDVDLENRIIHVKRSVEFVHNQAKLKDMPKTKNGIRDIPILDIYLPHIEKLCQGLKKEDFLFGGEKPLSETAIKKRWAGFCKHIGIDCRMHQLRHAYAKLLYEAGVDPKTAQHLLGHADIQTTMNIYTDFSNRMNTSALGKINSFLTSN